MTAAEEVIWHDLECGAYAADLALWQTLAEEAGGPVLDVGAGTGRVALDLARRGTAVVALDRDEDLLAALRDRAAGVPVETATADACDFALDRAFPLIVVPMQTIQILGGAERRMDFLRCARSHLAPGGTLALALVDGLARVAEGGDLMPALPDIREIDGTVYASRAVDVELVDGGTAITWLREVVPPDGAHRESRRTVVLDDLAPQELEAEGAAAGLTAGERSDIPSTDEYLGSTVVTFRG